MIFITEIVWGEPRCLGVETLPPQQAALPGPQGEKILFKVIPRNSFPQPVIRFSSLSRFWAMVFCIYAAGHTSEFWVRGCPNWQSWQDFFRNHHESHFLRGGTACSWREPRLSQEWKSTATIGVFPASIMPFWGQCPSSPGFALQVHHVLADGLWLGSALLLQGSAHRQHQWLPYHRSSSPGEVPNGPEYSQVKNEPVSLGTPPMVVMV